MKTEKIMILPIQLYKSSPICLKIYLKIDPILKFFKETEISSEKKYLFKSRYLLPNYFYMSFNIWRQNRLFIKVFMNPFIQLFPVITLWRLLSAHFVDDPSSHGSSITLHFKVPPPLLPRHAAATAAAIQFEPFLRDAKYVNVGCAPHDTQIQERKKVWQDAHKVRQTFLYFFSLLKKKNRKAVLRASLNEF